MTAPSLSHPHAHPARRRWAVVGLAASAWIVLYQLNKPFWEWLLGDVAGSDLGSPGDSVLFFVYDFTKIVLLLTGIIFLVTVLRSFMSVERTRALLGGRREGVGNVAAAGLGRGDPVLLVLCGAGVHRLRRRRRARSG